MHLKSAFNLKTTLKRQCCFDCVNVIGRTTFCMSRNKRYSALFKLLFSSIKYISEIRYAMLFSCEALIHSLTHPLNHSLPHPLTQSINHSLTYHSLTHPLTHSITSVVQECFIASSCVRHATVYCPVLKLKRPVPKGNLRGKGYGNTM